MRKIKLPVIDKEGKIKEGALVEGGSLEAGSPVLLSQAVNRFLANQRRARPRTKTRAEVRGSGAKIWRQKGTGHARHGDRQAPIFVGGGIAHGPTGRQNYQKKMNQKARQKAALSVLESKFKEKKLFLLEDLSFKKTKEAFSFVQKIRNNLSIRNKVGFILSKQDNLQRYLGNLKGVLLFRTQSLNPYLLLRADWLFLTKGALAQLGKREEKRAK